MFYDILTKFYKQDSGRFPAPRQVQRHFQLSTCYYKSNLVVCSILLR